jgi:ABC-2 type transport system permease protein
MKKTLLVAAREFMATVTTKGFVLGILATPAMIALVIFLVPRYLTRAPPRVEGRVAIIDRTGQAAAAAAAYLTPEAFAERRDKSRRGLEDAAPAAVRRQVAASPGGEAALDRSVELALGSVPKIQVATLPPGSAIDAAKAPLGARLPDGGPGPDTLLALMVIDPDAVRPAGAGQALGAYQLYVREKLDDRLVEDLHAAARKAIAAARIREAGLDPARIEALGTVPRQDSRTVTAEGESTTNRELNQILPGAFMALLLISVMTSGQYLLTTTVEEKSSRVVEVLLSAVSPMELMTGKIIGQMGVGLLVLALYAGLGLVALLSFATLGLLDPILLVFLLVFFVLSYFTFASLMAAIGAAVNEMREAQSLMTPVMMTLMVPLMLWLPLSREPNSMLAVVLSFVPPFGSFVMLLRMTSAAPPPLWQPLATVALGAAGVALSLWFAAKVFKVGLLMFGKPPTFATLIKWARMA